jgi:hypothetical protein
MRIASEFHDYYDVGMAEGQDQSLVYQRYPIVEERESYPFASIYLGYRLNTHSLYVRSYTIGFCGKMYKVLELNTLENGLRNDKESRSTRKWAYNLRDVDSYVKQYYPKQYSDYLEKNWRRDNSWCGEQRQHSFNFFFSGLPRHRYLDTNEDESAKTEEWRRSWFEKHRSPIFLAEHSSATYRYGSKITYNAQLKPFEFYRVFDPYQAYQEVAMWLGNQAVPIKPIPELDDVTMAESKGFNKFSFRKDPSKKRKRKGLHGESNR